MKQAILLFFVALPCFAAQGQNLRTTAVNIRDVHQIPALAYAVVTPDSVLEMDVIGYHKAGLAEEAQAVTFTDYFHIGSNTKAVTGFAAAYLVENGKIEWATKFFDLFPTWKGDSNPAFHDITLADLLSHRAGVKPYTSGPEYEQLPHFNGTKSEQRKQFVRYVLQEEPFKTQGRAYDYSNAGYSAAALMLEEVTQSPWEQLIDEILSEKLQLNYRFGWPNSYDVNQPWGHWVEKDSLVALPPLVSYNLRLGEPAGDISMPLADYAKFIQLNLQGLTGRSNILKAETYDFLHYGMKDYSIGWGNVKSEKQQLSEQVGSAGTFYCYALLDKKKKLGYIVICNSGAAKAVEGALLLRDRMMEDYGRRSQKL
jgi:D-alanyl-D-alanine carboxypeptidase